ncbi:Ig-like and fibronectin type-III domain-containing protein 1 isoform X2 [Varroa destructor]|uniref:Ig-like and fibronectin type-III domain-containing protein C25G4.10 n=1 Tax=Varroa destructor TaxID=109461 RepID=A0A7M7IYZ1_VARDE|nr:Ig-like and fibronectin type-III domain-containing protein 1 isoform X2 [Varroa destructor]
MDLSWESLRTGRRRLSPFSNYLLRVTLVVATLSVKSLVANSAVPSLQNTPLEPVLATSNEEALIDCVVTDQQNYTVFWRKLAEGDTGVVLTVGTNRVNGDSRFSVLHNKRHNSWVLRVFPTRVSDSGRYSCELNTQPNQKLTRLLTVIQEDVPVRDETVSLNLAHNYTACCARQGIPQECFGYCTLHGIVTGAHNSPRSCLEHISTLTECLTDGRNHMPCCEEQGIPKTCRSVCVGDYSLQTITEHYKCMDYTMQTLACISSGIELLPGQPKNVEVQPISPTQLRIDWLAPHQPTAVQNYVINITELTSFDPNLKMMPVSTETKPDDKKGSDEETSGVSLGHSIKLPSNQTSFTMDGLKPSTMYQISIFAQNSEGQSLPTPPIRVLTLSEFRKKNDGDKKAASAKETIPDIRACCVEKEVKQERCLRTMCDPSHAHEATLTDIMICAPWANVTFSCMANDIDHSDCCRRRGIPNDCLYFCTGKVTKIDYNHFKCLEYMPFYGSCVLEHYGVLPGNPVALSVNGVSEKWAVISWKPPREKADTVTRYSFYYRKLDGDDDNDPYFQISGVDPPYLLDGLEPSSTYEVFVAAENKFGSSEGSERLIFRTHDIEPEPRNITFDGYNETQCCVDAKLNPECLPLCSYKVKLHDLQMLGPKCMHQLDILMRCGAGGRDHTPCCQRYSVNPACISMCAGKTTANQYDSFNPRLCTREMGAILTCMEEGTGQIPSMPVDFHVAFTTPTSVHLEWDKPAEPTNVTEYRVFWTEVSADMVPPTPLNYTMNITVRAPMAIINNLTENTRYSFYAVAASEFGQSTPSLIVLVTTPISGVNDKRIDSVLSPPYGVEVVHSTVRSIAVKWQPPLHVPANQEVLYTVYFQATNVTGNVSDVDELPNTVTTMFTQTLLTNLTYDTQYKISVQARTPEGNRSSPMSEVVLAWTDAAIPAYVNLPLIAPIGPIREGSNITVACLGYGVPTPNTSIYINGQLLVALPQHQVAVTLQHITRNITRLSCYADNGYGSGGYTSLSVHVLSSPIVTIPVEEVQSEEGATARLSCKVSGFPEPQFHWDRDRQSRNSIRTTDTVGLQAIPDTEMPHTYTSSLILKHVSKADSGKYFCSATNQYGMMTRTVMLKVMDAVRKNSSSCCTHQGVSAACMPACAYDVDIMYALKKPECIQDLDKLMFCAADGSDHRVCCKSRGVPWACQRWCAGRPVQVPTHCALISAREVVSCFEEGKGILPGPPLKVKGVRLPGEIVVTWEPPTKHPEVVQWYKIFWRHVGSMDANKNETDKREFRFPADDDKIYEILVKAGNHYGMSQPADALVVHSNDITAYSERQSVAAADGSRIFISLLVALAVMAAAAAGFMWYYRRHKRATSGGGPSNAAPHGVSFENPTYLKDGISLSPATNSVNFNSVFALQNAKDANGGLKENQGGRERDRNAPAEIDLTDTSGPRAVDNHYEDFRHVRLH